MPEFKLVSQYQPKGDQVQAIEYLVKGIKSNNRHQVLLGVTGSGKTFTIANVIEQIQKPTLIISHNKTLAAQLYHECKQFFPQNAVEYFVSYYDYYQPEAYLPQTDTYIEKDSSINDEIDKMRHSATRSLLEREDVIIIASVSCIYGLGSPEAYYDMLLSTEKGQKIERDEILRKLVEIQYQRNDIDFHRGTFRVRGDVVEIFPTYEDDLAVRLEFFGDEIDKIYTIDPLRNKIINKIERVRIYPGSHYVTPKDRLETAMSDIETELEARLAEFKKDNKLLEAQRLEQRTKFDLEMIKEIGYCQGIENYSRHLTGRRAGEPTPTLIDYFPKDSLIVIDESHVTIPQIKAMAAGDHSRKKNLISYGFRLPSAHDNRPLTFSEFEKSINQIIYVSATPASYELQKSRTCLVEQIIRPTGLMDPQITIKPIDGQVDDLLQEINLRVKKGERVLITTLTKRMAEDLTEYYSDIGVKVQYLHSEIDTLKRIQIIRDLRLGKFDALIGINLLREGLDIPEVSLVAILDADKEGFLRSETSLIQTAGRAARNVFGEVIIYAEKMTKAIKTAVSETNRRRQIQQRYNEKHNITPESIKKSIVDILGSVYEADYYTIPLVSEEEEYYHPGKISEMVADLEGEMKKAAKNLEFEKAAKLRDKIKALKQEELWV